MTFDDILEQIIALLKRQGRVSYGALKMRFEEIDDKCLGVLKEEIVYVYESEVQADDRGLTWKGAAETISVMTSQPNQPETDKEKGNRWVERVLSFRQTCRIRGRLGACHGGQSQRCMAVREI